MTVVKNSGKSVLIVDDDETLREAIAYDFKRRGYRVFAAESGTAAFKIIKLETIDVVVTDIRMPNGNGIELLDWVKGHNARIPVVIFITGFMDLTLEDAYDRGACAVMTKPFDRKVLMETVQRALQTHSEKFAIPLDHPRCDWDVELKFHRGAESVRLRALGIGLGGMFLVSEHPVSLDQSVSFGIEHPTENLPLLRGQGFVRWVRDAPSEGRPRGFGIEFAYLDETCRKSVIEFLDNLRIKSFIPKTS